MTARVFVTLLMLVQVMACPFLDCGECRGACAVAQCAVSNDACDDCCRSETAACEREPAPCRDSDCPDNPGPLDCLCGGAVQADSVVCPDLLAGGELLALLDFERSDARLVVVAAEEFRTDGCPHFPPLISGMSVCALTQTYLL